MTWSLKDLSFREGGRLSRSAPADPVRAPRGSAPRAPSEGSPAPGAGCSHPPGNGARTRTRLELGGEGSSPFWALGSRGSASGTWPPGIVTPSEATHFLWAYGFSQVWAFWCEHQRLGVETEAGALAEGFLPLAASAGPLSRVYRLELDEDRLV